MATWKRLTKVDGITIHVNMDAVMLMQRHQPTAGPDELGHTVLMFPVREHEIWIKETPEEICALKAVMSP
jgi:hypothetical protein